MPRELLDIDIDEISLVDVPAIRKKFLIVKNKKEDMQNAIDKDRGDSDIKNLKEKEVLKVEELIKIYKNLTEDNEDFSKEQLELLKKLSDEAVSAIKGALNILNKFKGDFSQELKDAVAVLAKYATKPYPYPYPAKKSDEDLEKAGKKISKDTLNAIKKAIKILSDALSKGDETKKAITILSDLLSEEEKKALKKTDEEKERDDKEKERDEKFDSAIKEATETKEKLEKSLGEKDEKIADLTKRLETLEKAKGSKKQIEGQDEEDGDGDVKKSDDPWPSFANIGQEE
jgi:DNA repair exonuclease SbcCD ATPase subunit